MIDCLGTFLSSSSSINEHSDDDEHDHPYGQSNEEGVVFCMTNGQLICERSKEEAVLKCVKKYFFHFQFSLQRNAKNQKLEQTNVCCFCLKIG